MNFIIIKSIYFFFEEIKSIYLFIKESITTYILYFNFFFHINHVLLIAFTILPFNLSEILMYYAILLASTIKKIQTLFQNKNKNTNITYFHNFLI